MVETNVADLASLGVGKRVVMDDWLYRNVLVIRYNDDLHILTTDFISSLAMLKALVNDLRLMLFGTFLLPAIHHSWRPFISGRAAINLHRIDSFTAHPPISYPRTASCPSSLAPFLLCFYFDVPNALLRRTCPPTRTTPCCLTRVPLLDPVIAGA